MNKLFWKLLLRFFNFNHILSFSLINGRLSKSVWILLWNFIMPHAAYIIIGFLPDLSKYMDTKVSNVQNVSSLFVRITKVFPLLTNYSILLVIILTMQHEKMFKLAKKISRLIKVLDYDCEGELCKLFERRCFLIWILTQLFLITGALFNTFSIIKMQLDSFVVMTLLTWTLSSSSHIILICIFTMQLFASLVTKVSDDIVSDPNLPKSLCRLRCIAETIAEFRSVTNFVMSMAFTKLLVEILILVMEKQ